MGKDIGQCFKIAKIESERVSKGELEYGKRKLEGIGLSLPMSVMRR